MLMAEQYKIDLGRAIRARRKALGMTQKDLATATHYKEAQTVSRWERGETAPVDLGPVAEALRSTVADLTEGIIPPDGKAARYLGLPATSSEDQALADRIALLEDAVSRLLAIAEDQASDDADQGPGRSDDSEQTEGH